MKSRRKHKFEYNRKKSKLKAHQQLIATWLITLAQQTASVSSPTTITWYKKAFLVIASLLVLASGGVLAYNVLNQPTTKADKLGVIPPSLNESYVSLTNQISSLENDEATHKITVVSDSEIRDRINEIQGYTNTGKYSRAIKAMSTLSSQVDVWQKALSGKIAAAAALQAANNATTIIQNNALNIPIVLFHYTPANFEQQLQVLVARKYTTVSLDQVAAAMAGHGALPAKPVVLTFDDGFENQMVAFSLLQKYQMKATYYIINGGAASDYCIGAGRTYNQPKSCGDAYLTWDQVRQLDKSGLITIGGHTLDHLALATKSAAVQRQQIFDSKAGIEQQLGHAIYDFAYPYGSFNATTINLVSQAGFRTAVTTLPGTYQTIGQPFALKRIRGTLNLP